MDVRSIVTVPEAQKGFYPTPKKVAMALLEGIDWSTVKTALDPSAGKGDLVYHTLAEIHDSGSRAYRDAIEVDIIEIDPTLQATCIGRFSAETVRQLNKRKDALYEKRRYHQLWKARPEDYNEEYPAPTEEELAELEKLTRTCDTLDYGMVRLVADDFLTFRTAKKYDLIVMNPPFADGAAHLEKAIAMQKQYGGKIRCVLNAETIRNPYTMQRQMLAKALDKLGAEIRYMEDGFVDAERETAVEVALISIDIPAPEFQSDIFERMAKAAEAEETVVCEGVDLALSDMFARMVSQFNVAN